jgi:hypothetical protein
MTRSGEQRDVITQPVYRTYTSTVAKPVLLYLLNIYT